MSSLSKERNYLVTGSNAHRIMGGFESQLEDYVFNEFDQWQTAYMLINDRITDIRALKKHIKDITAEKRDRVLKLIESEKPFEMTKGMFSYAIEIAMAYFVTEKESGYQNEAMENGVLNEIDAVLAAQKYLGVEFDLTLDDQEFFKKENIGLTPDGILFNHLLLPSEGLEVKSPTQKVHFFNIKNVKTQKDLLNYYPEYYWQCMTGIAVTGANKWHWASYNESFFDGYQLAYVEVFPVKDHVNLLLERAEMVVKKSLEIVEEIKTNNFKNTTQINQQEAA